MRYSLRDVKGIHIISHLSEAKVYLEIALKECYETEYWLEILYKVNSLTEDQYKAVSEKCGTIRRKLIASITTAKKNNVPGADP